MADDLLEQALELDPSAACVEGDIALVMAVVSRLEQSGVACYEATRLQVAPLEPLRFSGWRRYPSFIPRWSTP